MPTKSLQLVTDDVNPEVVGAILALRRVTQTELGQVLGLHSSQIGRRLKGALGWSAADVRKLSRHLKVDMELFYLPTDEFLERLSTPKRQAPPDGGIPSDGATWAPRGSNPRPSDVMFDLAA